MEYPIHGITLHTPKGSLRFHFIDYGDEVVVQLISFADLTIEFDDLPEPIVFHNRLSGGTGVHAIPMNPTLAGRVWDTLVATEHPKSYAQSQIEEDD